MVVSKKVFNEKERPQEVGNLGIERGQFSTLIATVGMYRFLPWLLLFLSLLVSGCPRLPEYALPHVGVMDDSIFSGKGFTYRKLTVHDFRAQSPSKALSGHSNSIFAHSSIQLRLSKETKFIITSGYSDYFDQTFWSGHVRFIGFEAVFIPDNSWWNPKVPPEKRAYVLQHEQIHFALMELAARQLSQRARKDLASFFVIDSNRQGVEEQLREKISTLTQEENKIIVQEHTAFDEDASLYFDPEKQQWWFDNVNKQLREFRNYSHDLDPGRK
jgi:hypothetical protein